jgi:hypothetical protein
VKVTVTNDDASQTLHMKDEAAGADFTVAPNGSQTRDVPTGRALMYFSVPSSSDAKDWKRYTVGAGGTVRLRLVNGVWTPSGP